MTLEDAILRLDEMRQCWLGSEMEDVKLDAEAITVVLRTLRGGESCPDCYGKGRQQFWNGLKFECGHCRGTGKR